MILPSHSHLLVARRPDNRAVTAVTMVEGWGWTGQITYRIDR